MQFVGCHHGHFDDGQVPELIELIRQSKADVLLVAMGNPKQELFIQKHLAATGCTLGIGVGALFDFLAGNVPRAMPWVQGLRLEWLYRLAQEPRRLARRYLVGIPVFLTRILGQWWSGSRVMDAGPGLVGDRVIVPARLCERGVAAQEACLPDIHIRAGQGVASGTVLYEVSSTRAAATQAEPSAISAKQSNPTRSLPSARD